MRRAALLSSGFRGISSVASLAARIRGRRGMLSYSTTALTARRTANSSLFPSAPTQQLASEHSPSQNLDGKVYS